MNTSLDKLTEDGCGIPEKDKVCRARGGESCAFDGAMVVLQPIADTAHIVHGSIACCGNSWEGRGSLSDVRAYYDTPLHRMGFTTDLNELDIIYGSEEKLLGAIDRTQRAVKPKAIFVYATCVSGLTGEDIESVCRKARETLGINAIPVNAPGFVGPKNLGNRIAGEALLDYVIGTGTPGLDKADAVNLIGEYNIAGDLRHIEPLFEEAGIPVLSRISGNATFQEITYAHKACLNVVVCGRALVNVAKEMQRKYGIPYVEVSFFGKTEIAKALRLVASNLQLRITNYKLTEKIEAIITEEEALLARKLQPYSHLKGKKAVLYTGGVKSWSFISALLDLGIEVVAVGTKKSTFEDEERMKEILGADAPLVENVTPGNLRKLIRDNKADMLIAGGRNLYLAMKEAIPFVDVNQERHIAYAGYEGFVNFAEQISNGIRFFSRKSEYEVKSSICNLKSDVSINPLKHSQSIGAAIALQGIDRALPIIHGAQGCNFLAKVLITKHFREPIALASTKLFTEDVVMGSEENAVNVAKDFAEKQSPDLIGILTSGLSEIKGDNIRDAVKEFKIQDSRFKIMHVSTPDYEGGMETGYAKAIRAVLQCAVKTTPKNEDLLCGKVNILAGPHLTPADFIELREIIESFGLIPVILPDLSSLDGSREGFSPLSSGGTGMREIETMNGSAFTIAIGTCMETPAKFLQEKYGIEYTVLESIAGLNGTDTLMKMLSALSGNPVSLKYRKQRRSLVDGMRDAHFYLSGKKVCIALEPDLSLQTAMWLGEMAADVELTVIPTLSRAANAIQTEKIIVGDLFSVKGDFDLLISNSHAEDTAMRLGAPLYQMGFPVYKVLGYTTKVTIGYRGTLTMINDTANLVMKEVH